MANPLYPNETTSSEVPHETFETIANALVILHSKKNNDYGDTFSSLFHELSEKDPKYGMIYAIGHLKEKVKRIEQLTLSKQLVKTESVKDSLADLASYAIMTLSNL